MKKAIVLIMLFSFNAQASMTLFCAKGETPASCAPRAEAAVQKLGCVVDLAQTNCTFSRQEDPNKPGSTIVSTTPYCELTAANCAQPRLGNFGGETCDKGEKVNMSRAEKVNNGYWFGLFGAYSRTICVVK
jgi:hypothetical protein